LSGGGINVSFLRPLEPQLSAMRCVTLNQIDPSHMICDHAIFSPDEVRNQTWKSRNSSSVSGRGVGTEGMETDLATDSHSETNTKRSQITFFVTSIALNLGHLRSKLLDFCAVFKG